MRLVQLSLRNFRNFRELETAFPPGPTLLIGANAQGKTSLLESIHYLTAASSRQARSDRELIHFGAWGIGRRWRGWPGWSARRAPRRGSKSAAGPGAGCARGRATPA